MGLRGAGDVVLDGVDLAKLPEARLTRVRSETIGFVFQPFNLIPTPTAQENVETALVPLGKERGLTFVMVTQESASARRAPGRRPCARDGSA